MKNDSELLTEIMIIMDQELGDGWRFSNYKSVDYEYGDALDLADRLAKLIRLERLVLIE